MSRSTLPSYKILEKKRKIDPPQKEDEEKLTRVVSMGKNENKIACSRIKYGN